MLELRDLRRARGGGRRSGSWWRTSPWRVRGPAGTRPPASASAAAGRRRCPRYTLGNFSAIAIASSHPRPPEVGQHERRVAEVERGAVDADRATALARHQPTRRARLQLPPARRRRRTPRSTGSSRRGRGGGPSCACAGSSPTTHGASSRRRISRTPRIPRSRVDERERGEPAGPARDELLDLVPAVATRCSKSYGSRVPCRPVSPVGSSTVAMPSSSIRATNVAGLGEAVAVVAPHLHLRRRSTRCAPSHSARRSGVNALHKVSTIAVTRYRSSRNRFSFGDTSTSVQRVERTGRHDLGARCARRAAP